MKAYRIFLTFIIIFKLGASINVYAQDHEDQDKKEVEGDVVIKVKPAVKNAIFKGSQDIGYKLDVNNLYDEEQEGKFSYLIKTDLGEKVLEQSEDFKIGRKTKKSITVKIPPQKAGFYNLSFRFNLTQYDDTLHKVFGVDAETLKSPLHKPADFDEFWDKTRRELAQIPPQYKITLQHELSDADRKVYLVEMKSYNYLLIRGWLVVPKQSYKQPVHYRLPGYVVGLNPNYDTNHFITFNLNVRGNGNSQDVVNVGTEDYCYNRIQSKESYIYRGVYMDCLRGLDFLYSHPELGIDTSKIYVEGSSQGGTLAVITAAMDKRAKLLAIQVPLYSDFRLAKEVGLKYDKPEFPIKFFTRYINNNTDTSWDKIFSVMDYYDPQNFAPMVTCPVIMGIGLLDKFCPPRCSFSLFNHFASKKKEWFSSPDLTHEVAFDYYMLQNIWLGENFRLVY